MRSEIRPGDTVKVLHNTLNAGRPANCTKALIPGDMINVSRVGNTAAYYSAHHPELHTWSEWHVPLADVQLVRRGSAWRPSPLYIALSMVPPAMIATAVTAAIFPSFCLETLPRSLTHMHWPTDPQLQDHLNNLLLIGRYTLVAGLGWLGVNRLAAGMARIGDRRRANKEWARKQEREAFNLQCEKDKHYEAKRKAEIEEGEARERADIERNNAAAAAKAAADGAVVAAAMKEVTQALGRTFSKDVDPNPIKLFPQGGTRASFVRDPCDSSTRVRDADGTWRGATRGDIVNVVGWDSRGLLYESGGQQYRVPFDILASIQT